MSVWCSTSSFSTLRWWQSLPSQCCYACVYFSWSFQSFLAACYPLALVFLLCVYVMDSVTMFPPLPVWEIVVIDAACRYSRSDRQPLEENTGFENGAWDFYISLPGCLHASDTSKSGWVTVYTKGCINHRARIWFQLFHAQLLTIIIILKQTKWQKLIRLCYMQQQMKLLPF